MALADQKLKNSWLTENRFDDGSSKIFVMAVTKMALAKNIKLADGTLKVWEECVIEDIRAGCYELDDFIKATKKVIRTQAYNRIDYADIYKEAMENGETWRGSETSEFIRRNNI